MRYADGFLLLIRGTDKRFTKTLYDWLKTIHEQFGDKLWHNVILVVSVIKLCLSNAVLYYR